MKGICESAAQETALWILAAVGHALGNAPHSQIDPVPAPPSLAIQVPQLTPQQHQAPPDWDPAPSTARWRATP